MKVGWRLTGKANLLPRCTHSTTMCPLIKTRRRTLNNGASACDATTAADRELSSSSPSTPSWRGPEPYISACAISASSYTFSAPIYDSMMRYAARFKVHPGTQVKLDKDRVCLVLPAEQRLSLFLLRRLFLKPKLSRLAAT